jgi:hypothetical protein
MTILTAPQAAQVREALELAREFLIIDGHDPEAIGPDTVNAALALLVPAEVPQDAREFAVELKNLSMMGYSFMPRREKTVVDKYNIDRMAALIAARDAALVDRCVEEITNEFDPDYNYSHADFERMCKRAAIREAGGTR